MNDLLLFSHIDTFALAQYEFVPIGILSIATYLNRFNINVDVIHGEIKNISDGYKLYGISTTTNQYYLAKQALNKIRKINPDAKVVLGGPHLNAESCIKECLKDDWDYLIIGDGELALLDILKNNVSTRIIYGKPLDNLDLLHPLDFSKLDLTRYNFPLREDLKCINVMTSRGCPYRCAFCSTSNTKLRQRSSQNVINELKFLIDNYGFDSFMFVDDTMSLNKKRFHQILNGIKELNVKWRSYGRVNALNKKDLELMLESGCIEVAIGVESGSQKILDIIRKGTNVNKNLEFVKLCKNIGIKCNTMLIIGLPGETKDTIYETELWMKEAKPEAFGYNIFFPFPDCPIKIDKSFDNLITIYDYKWDEAFTKAKNINKCFIATPALTREDILKEYHRNFELFIEITGFDPRQRGLRKLCK